MWSAARWSSDTYWNARTLQCIYTNKKQSNCLKSFVCACVFSNLNNILQFYFNNNQDNEWNINILNNLFKVATIYCTRGEHANHYTTNAVHFRRRIALDANMYFRLKCHMLQHKPQDIINISHLNLKNVLRWTNMRMMKLIQTRLHKQKNV